MKLIEIYNKIIKESLSQESVKDFYDRFNNKRKSTFLIDHFKNPNFELRLTHEGGVKVDDACGMYNRCETNTFNFISNKVKNGDHRYFPVSGWAFMESTTYFEHFWVYDAVNDLFLDVTPMHDGKLAYAYGGVINKDINDEIVNAEKFSDVKFLLGKHFTSLYADFIDNESNPKLNSYVAKDNHEEQLFDFIENSSKYSELSYLIKSTNSYSIKELRLLIPKLKEMMYNVRNNKEYVMYDKLIKQIETISSVRF